MIFSWVCGSFERARRGLSSSMRGFAFETITPLESFFPDQRRPGRGGGQSALHRRRWRRVVGDMKSGDAATPFGALLDNQEGLLSALIDAVPDPIFCKDVTGTFSAREPGAL